MFKGCFSKAEINGERSPLLSNEYTTVQVENDKTTFIDDAPVINEVIVESSSTPNSLAISA